MTESQAAIEEQMRIDDINEERLNMEEKIQISDREVATLKKSIMVELVSKELNHLAAILHVYAGGLNFMKLKKKLLLFFKKKMEILLHFYHFYSKKSSKRAK